MSALRNKDCTSWPSVGIKVMPIEVEITKRRLCKNTGFLTALINLSATLLTSLMEWILYNIMANSSPPAHQLGIES